jgi:flagellar basal body-associated protein FliL
MAQAEETLDEDNEHEEAEELEKLLASTDSEDAEVAEGDEQPAKKGGRFSFSKKIWILLGAGTFLMLLLAGGAYFFLLSDDKIPDEGLIPGEQAGGDISTPVPVPVETVKSSFSKVHIFTLEPFFLPLKKNNRETGKFISVIPNLILSNSTLHKELENSLPSIRRNIYNLLSRKNPREYYSNKRKIKERIKKEILITVNPTLLAGTGTVTDVVFTQFVVK